MKEVFPDLASVHPVTVLSEGFRSLVIETADGVLFRIAKNAEACAGHAREVRLLPVLAGHLPVSVPAPRWYAQSAPGFPFGLIGYEKLPGRHVAPGAFDGLDSGRLACSLAVLLRALHGVPIETARALGVPDDHAASPGRLEALRDAVLPALRDRLPRGDCDRIAEWWDAFLGDAPARDFEPVVRHGDLWFENLLVDESSSLCGVLDFEACRIGDPSADFSVQLYLGEEFTARVLSAYAAAGGTVDSDLLHRLWWQFELREFDGVRFSLEHDDIAELEDSIRKIRSSPILSPERWRAAHRRLARVVGGAG